MASQSPEKNREYRERFAAKPKIHVEEKTCRVCGETKPRTAYSKMGASKDGLQSYCKPCAADKRRWTYYETTYNLTRDQYVALLLKQGCVCAICNESPAPSRERREMRWVVDHDHSCCPGQGSCGECVRGLLCSTCNRAIGMMKDDPNRLLSAAAYILSTRDVLSEA